MLMVDVNILVFAFREAAERHGEYRRWLNALVDSDESYGVSDHVLAGFVRIVTHAKIFQPPTPVERALEFAEDFRSRDNAVLVVPGERHWGIFTRLCRDAEARGNLVPDAWLAALAIERGCEFVTADRDYARFPGLRWRHPLRAA